MGFKGLYFSLIAAVVCVLGGLACASAYGQITDPAITSWRMNTSGATGVGGTAAIDDVVSLVLADVTRVRYTGTDVYVESNSIPSHSVGPFLDGNPSIPSSQATLVRIPRTTPSISGAPTATPLSSIGIFINGVTFYNQSDATSWEDENTWYGNAIIKRADGMDGANGHPSPVGGGGPPPRTVTDNGILIDLHTHVGKGELHSHETTARGAIVEGLYHYHFNPVALRDQLGDNGTEHSPLLGFGYDGIPVYGPYGYDNIDGSGGVVRIETSYQLRAISDRSTLPDGSPLAVNLHGPAINATYPLGYFIQDFEYEEGLGHLDSYNGRFAITPEYPNGVYAYYTTIDGSGDGAYPYIMGPNYYAAPLADNAAGSVSVPGSAAEYLPSGNTAVSTIPPGRPVVEGGRLTLAGPPGSDYQWKLDGTPIANDPPRITGATSRYLVIDPVELGDAGSYTVEYEDGTVRAAAESDPFVVFVFAMGTLGVGSVLAVEATIMAILIFGIVFYLRRKERDE